MQPHTFLLAASTGFAFGIFPLSAANPAVAPGHAYRVRAVEQAGRPIVELGASEFSVRRLLGEPSRRLSPDTRAYLHFGAYGVGTFDRDDRMKLANSAAEQLIAGEIEACPLAAPRGSEVAPRLSRGKSMLVSPDARCTNPDASLAGL